MRQVKEVLRLRFERIDRSPRPSMPSSRLANEPLRRYFLLTMANAARGVLRGVTITLDAPVPPLEGLRVRLVIEPETESHENGDLSPAEHAVLLREWATRGPQGPIDDDEDFPEPP